MTIEAILTRKLNIRFIDARAFVTEAKLNLGVEGYPASSQEELLIAEAINIFENRPEDVRKVMHILKSDLDAIKIPIGSLSSIKSDASCSSEDESVSSSSSSRRGLRFFRTR